MKQNYEALKGADHIRSIDHSASDCEATELLVAVVLNSSSLQCPKGFKKALPAALRQVLGETINHANTRLRKRFECAGLKLEPQMLEKECRKFPGRPDSWFS